MSALISLLTRGLKIVYRDNVGIRFPHSLPGTNEIGVLNPTPEPST